MAVVVRCLDRLSGCCDTLRVRGSIGSLVRWLRICGLVFRLCLGVMRKCRLGVVFSLFRRVRFTCLITCVLVRSLITLLLSRLASGLLMMCLWSLMRFR